MTQQSTHCEIIGSLGILVLEHMLQILSSCMKADGMFFTMLGVNEVVWSCMKNMPKGRLAIIHCLYR